MSRKWLNAPSLLTANSWLAHIICSLFFLILYAVCTPPLGDSAYKKALQRRDAKRIGRLREKVPGGKRRRALPACNLSGIVI